MAAGDRLVYVLYVVPTGIFMFEAEHIPAVEGFDLVTPVALYGY